MIGSYDRLVINEATMNQISDKAVISPKAKIGNNVKIFPFVYIEDYVEIGDN